MQLKKASHINFNIKCIFYQDNIYIYPGVYYYANFNAGNLKLFINYLIGYPVHKAKVLYKPLTYKPLTYKQWADNHPDQKWAQHNYKIDKEDLAKIGIEA